MIDATGCTITLYTQNECADSPAVRAWLTGQAIPFTERNVTTDPGAAEALAYTGLFATPLLTICSHRVVGNRPRLIAQTIEGCEVRRS